MRLRITALLTAALALPLLAGHGGDGLAPPVAKSSEPVKPLRALPTADEAVRFALADAKARPFDAPFIRYLWWPSMEDGEAKSAALTLNTVSRGTSPHLPPAVPGFLLRVDLRQYAPQANDLTEWLRLWEDFQLDPAFSLLVTKDELANLSPGDRQRIEVRQPVPATPAVAVEKPATREIDNRLGYRCAVSVTLPADAVLWIAGEQVQAAGRVREFVSPPLPRLDRVYEYELKARLILPSGEAVDVRRTVDVQAGFRTDVEIAFPMAKTAAMASNVAVIRFDSEAIDPAAFGELQRLTGSNAPVVSANYFMMRSLETIKRALDKKDDEVYATVFGGRYYELRGIKKAKDVLGQSTKATDLDLFLENLGVGNIKAGLRFQELFDRLRSDQRVAMFRSGVTGKPRAVLMFHSPGGTAEGNPWVTITLDIRDQDIDIGTHPIMNLLNTKTKAMEVIATNPNGTHIYALFNGDGGLIDEATNDVATDRTIPAPNTPRLQSALSCIACHEAQGHDGWQPLKNDVKQLLSGKLDIFADLLNRNALQADTIDRLKSYAGNFDRNLTRARDDYALAVLHASGTWPDSDNQVKVVKAATTYLVDHVRGYQYGMVDARQALRELGLEVPEGKITLPNGRTIDRAVAILNQVLPPDPDGRIGPIFPEDPRLGALKQALAIPRHDWALTQGFAARRSKKAIEKLRGVKQ